MGVPPEWGYPQIPHLRGYPRMGYPKWGQNPIVYFEPQTGVNVDLAHIPLQKGGQIGAQIPLFWTPF